MANKRSNRLRLITSKSVSENAIDDLPAEVAYRLIEERLQQEVKIRNKSTDIAESYAQAIVKGISANTFVEVVKLQMQKWQSLWEIGQEDVDFAKCFLNLLNENHEKLPQSLYEEVTLFAFDNIKNKMLNHFELINEKSPIDKK
ncbi:hypothetical protein [Thermonema sp.]|uniref:hypothetical protein n=1 Tax=Thermonema sp. TaxID=2231181 RepID=UPI00258D1591|nr:hypothetical protein [Thermonema sp.]